jgi:hypothetical protein
MPLLNCWQDVLQRKEGILTDFAQAVGWCSLPFPQYPLPGDLKNIPGAPDKAKTPGHGPVRVQVNFWFFLFVYYGFYNLTALIWISKVFNLYSLNWYGHPISKASCPPISLDSLT